MDLGRRRLVGAAGSLAAGAALAAGTNAAAATRDGAAASPGAARKGGDATPSARRRFADRVVAVTGGSRGIGRAAVLAFAREGAKVGFCARGADDGRATERAVRDAGGDATFFAADVTDDAALAAFFDGTAARYGGLHAGLHNAGITLPATPLHDIDPADWDRVLATNLRAVYIGMRAQLPHLLRAGGGAVVITSSFHQQQTRPGFAAYAASKHALPGLAKAAAMDYGTQGIRVNLVAPGIVDTPLFRGSTGADPKAVADASARVDALKRIASAGEIADAALWLASDDARYVTGTTLLVDGGLTAGI